MHDRQTHYKTAHPSQPSQVDPKPFKRRFSGREHSGLLATTLMTGFSTAVVLFGNWTEGRQPPATQSSRRRWATRLSVWGPILQFPGRDKPGARASDIKLVETVHQVVQLVAGVGFPMRLSFGQTDRRSDRVAAVTDEFGVAFGDCQFERIAAVPAKQL